MFHYWTVEPLKLGTYVLAKNTSNDVIVKTLTFALPLIISSKMIVFCKLRIWFLQKFNNFTNKKLDFFREIVCFSCIQLFANNFVCWKMQTIFVCERFAKYTTYLVAFDTLGGKLVFITLGTINVMFFGDEGFCANWIVTCATNETFFVPLSSLVFHFLHSCKKNRQIVYFIGLFS